MSHLAGSHYAHDWEYEWAEVVGEVERSAVTWMQIMHQACGSADQVTQFKHCTSILQTAFIGNQWTLSTSNKVAFKLCDSLALCRSVLHWFSGKLPVVAADGSVCSGTSNDINFLWLSTQSILCPFIYIYVSNYTYYVIPFELWFHLKWEKSKCCRFSFLFQIGKNVKKYMYVHINMYVVAARI